jgi:hypothetical protein
MSIQTTYTMPDCTTREARYERSLCVDYAAQACELAGLSDHPLVLEALAVADSVHRRPLTQVAEVATRVLALMHQVAAPNNPKSPGKAAIALGSVLYSLSDPATPIATKAAEILRRVRVAAGEEQAANASAPPPPCRPVPQPCPTSTAAVGGHSEGTSGPTTSTPPVSEPVKARQLDPEWAARLQSRLSRVQSED